MPLIQAAFTNDWETVVRLIEKEKVDIETKMEDGTTTALVASAYKPSGEVMWYLVGNGAYVKAVNPLGLTSLHIAVLFGERDYINGQLMLTKAAVNIPNNKGDTILLNRELYANFKNFSPGEAQLMKEALLALIAYCSP